MVVSALVHLALPLSPHLTEGNADTPVTIAVADMLAVPLRVLVGRLRELDEELTIDGSILASRLLTLRAWDQQGSINRVRPSDSDDAEDTKDADEYGIVRPEFGRDRCFATVALAPSVDSQRDE